MNRDAQVISTLNIILEIISRINLGGLTKQGFIVDEECGQGNFTFTHIPRGVKVPDDFLCQSPDFTEKHLVGQCDSIAALIAARCDQVRWNHYDFVTECDGISLWSASHHFVIIETPLGFIRGDMPLSYLQEHGLFKFYTTLNRAMNAYVKWACQVFHCQDVILHKYDASDPIYYGMSFNSMVKRITGKTRR